MKRNNEQLKKQITLTAGQFTRYVIVGAMNTLITLSVIFLLMKIFACSYLISNAAGYLLGFINSFFMNKRWTFRSRNSLTREGLFFVMLFFVCYLLQLTFLIFLKEHLHIKADHAQFVAMIFYALLNFTGNKFITFRS